jgi:ribosomal protein S27E
MPDVQWDGHGEETNTVFSLVCRCGGRQFELRGFKWRNPDFHNMEVFLSPIELKCLTCATSEVVFDSAKHGYDAALGHGSSTVRAKGAPGTYACEKCGGSTFMSVARFEYTDDLFDGSFDDFAGGKEELFTWASIAVTCAKCGQLSIPGDFECA